MSNKYINKAENINKITYLLLFQHKLCRTERSCMRCQSASLGNLLQVTTEVKVCITSTDINDVAVTYNECTSSCVI